jgi:hypothetical protein
MLGLDKDLYSRTTIYIPGLDNIRKTRCVLSLINPINKMYAMLASLKKKPVSNWNIKYEIVKKNKIKHQKKKEHMKCSYMYVYTCMIFAAVLSQTIKIFHRHLGPNL